MIEQSERASGLLGNECAKGCGAAFPAVLDSSDEKALLTAAALHYYKLHGCDRYSIAHHGLTQAAAAKAMRISPGVICDVIKDRKPVSTELALRLEHCLGLSADFILKVQAHFQYCVAYHAKSSLIAAEVKVLVTA